MTRCQKVWSGGARGTSTGADISGMQCRRPLLLGSCISTAAVTVICGRGAPPPPTITTQCLGLHSSLPTAPGLLNRWQRLPGTSCSGARLAGHAKPTTRCVRQTTAKIK